MNVDDPFATTSSLGEFDEDPDQTSGRYRLPDLLVDDVGNVITLGKRTGGWQRVTNLVKNIGDSRALMDWRERKVVAGLVLRPDLYDLATSIDFTAPDADIRKRVQDIANKAAEAAGASAGANLGTAFHGFTDAVDAGLMHYAREKWLPRLENYRTALQAHRLRIVPEFIERKVAILSYGCVGKLDRLLWDEEADCLRVGDLKTQKKFWTWLEISAQLALYQMADAMWDRAQCAWVEMPPVTSDFAVVAWMPVEHPDGTDRVDVFNVDLEQGRGFVETCAAVNRDRSTARSTKQTIGLLRPLPEMSAVEAYARRLRDVSSLAEGSAVVAEAQARGVWCDELQEVALSAVNRLTSGLVSVG